jgi:NAD(P)-dependent dehydrogenase (short-subunit alcohol dehydrogenase family)
VLLNDRVAVVTGGGSGIGREISEVFAAEGARIAVLDRTRESGEAVVEALAAAHPAAPQPLFFELDVRLAEQVDAAMRGVADEAGRIDILVNSAGVREIRDVFALPTEEWDTVIAINLSGTFYSCQAAARRMRDTGGGSIVNLASVAGLTGIARRPAYSAAKHGIVGLTKSLARDLAEAGIRVNAICPGLIRTPLTEQYFVDDTFERALAQTVPLQRHGTTSEVAQAALYLVSEMASYVTGIALPVDGGFLAEKSMVYGSGGSSFLKASETG